MTALTTRCDPERAAAFQQRMLDSLNAAAMCLMSSIGHRTGLFDTLASLPPATSQQIADAAGLTERYVREWLHHMVVSDVVEHDADRGLYWLPAEHASCFGTNAPDGNFGVFMQYIPLMGMIEDDIIACFRNGGGVPYERYHRFHEVMAEDSSQSVLPALRDYILPLVPGLIERLETGIRVLDVGCGRGKAMTMLAGMFPKSRFVGYDLSAEAIEWANANAKAAGCDNVQFFARDVTTFDEDAEPGAFDFIATFDAIHDQARPAAVLRGIRNSLAEGGVYLAQDIKGTSHVHQDRGLPLAPLLYAVSCLHCMSVSLAQGGDGLGAMWGRETAERMMRDAGFGTVEVHELEHDPQNYYYVCRP